MTTTQITKFGDAIGIVLPQEILARLGVQPGDAVSLVETAQGGVEIALLDEEASSQLKVAREVMREDRQSLRKLAE